MAEKKGICRNYVNCSLADKEEVQIVDDLDFVCAQCGKPLEPVDGKPDKVSMDPNKKRLLIIIGAAVVAIGLVVGGILAFGGKKDNSDTGVESIPPVEQTVDEVSDKEELAVEEQKPTSKPVQTTNNGSITSKWNGVATYDGPKQGGKPHGIGGTLKFNSYYTLDLKDGNGGTIDIKPGESIHNAKMDNGVLIQGELHRNDGTRKWFNIGH